jgi:hypothetical protein
VPANVRETAATSTSVDMAWSASTDNVGVAGYDLYINGSRVGTTAGTVYSFSGLGNCGTTYALAVDAYDKRGNRSAEASMSAATQPCSTTTTGTPSPMQCPTQPFCGDFETGDYSQWWLHQWSINPDPSQGYTNSNVGSSELTVESSLVRQGRYAGMFQVFPHSGPSANDRAEIVASQSQSGGYPGQEWYYGWWTYFPGPSQDWWHQGGDWNAITQFQSTDDSGGWIGFGIDATTGTARLFQDSPLGHFTIGNLQYDHWYHFVTHAIWSTDPSAGLWEVWIDGSPVFSAHMQTLKNQNSPASSSFTSPGMYVSQGVYRGAYSSTNTVIHDGFCRAASYAEAAAC